MPLLMHEVGNDWRNGEKSKNLTSFLFGSTGLILKIRVGYNRIYTFDGFILVICYLFFDWLPLSNCLNITDV